MKRKEIVAIVAVALGLIVWSAVVSKAEPMGTAWTYQGRLLDANGPPDGLYDFQFKLFDANVAGNEQGSPIDISDLDVIDGYFTVELDFGSNVFNGNARWLEILVRPADSNDSFNTLGPRQQVTPTPYALQTRGIFVDDSGNVGIGMTWPPNKKLTVAGGGFGVYPTLAEPVIITDGFNVRLGDPDGAENQVFLDIDDLNEKFVFNNGSVGIGTSSPDKFLTLEKQGQAGSAPQIKIKGYYDGSGGGSYLVMGKSRGSTVGDNQTTANGDPLGLIDIFGINYLGNEATATRMMFKQDGLSFSPYIPGRIEFYTSNGSSGAAERMRIDKDGKVGIGTTDPQGKLDVRSSTDTSCMFVVSEGTSVNAWFSVDNTSGGNAIMATSSSNLSPTVRIINTGSAEALFVSGTAKVDVLQIMGADMAEKFPVRHKETIKPGMVVAIDPDHPGELRLSRAAYDQCVAGVISGANNLPAGAILGNLTDHEDGLPVALSGRVWVYCDAGEKPIEPGNLLTTAERPGYAMAVSNFEKAHGAVIGKAMTRLEKGKTGLVLVLVNLQ